MPRICAWRECDTSIEGYHGNARYCSGRCRSAAYKDRTGYRLVAVRNPPQTRNFRLRQRSGGQRGLALPWKRAVDTLAEYLTHDSHSADEAQAMTAEATRILAPALSDKQRERLKRPQP